ncbi:hypothetical protein BJ138DRAFT_1152779 [Hygrophoropsis aurantiaca]|uniref:Uncharacterized protein n=1 Tax=Hygrophoropsis aurantiaca TaxID=72124 RepID=A0ACB8ABN2_9AGAM|nr:hypothetical protein BJ138DRAFT_1152779 [Hygrophoropsis aurantiaca]
MDHTSPENIVLDKRLQIVMVLAPVALWGFEYLLTLDDEIRTMWTPCSRCWTRFHFLFIITRCLPIVSSVCLVNETLLTNLTFQTCWPLYEVGGWTSVIVVIATETLLLMRTLTMWHDTTKFKRILISIYALALVVIIGCYTIVYVIGMGSICNYRSNGYVADVGYQVISGPYWAVAVFESSVICMAMYRGSLDRADLGDEYSGTRLMNALRHGNLIYACSLFVMSISNITFYMYPPSEGWSGMVYVFQCVLHGSLGSRITFELRRADQSEDPMAPISDIQFASARLKRQRRVFDDQHYVEWACAPWNTTTCSILAFIVEILSM